MQKYSAQVCLVGISIRKSGPLDRYLDSLDLHKPTPSFRKEGGGARGMCALWVDITCQKRTASWEGGVGQVGMSTVIRPYHNIFCQAWLWQLLAVFKLTPPPSTPQRIPGGGGALHFNFHGSLNFSRNSSSRAPTGVT